MRKLLWTGLAAGVLTFGVSAPALSHHSHAMFDHTQVASVTGTVSAYTFRNPHIFLYVDVEAEGEIVHYWIEMSNIQIMTRRGVGPKTFQVGDEVTVSMWPLKDGRPGGNYSTIIAADGTIYE
jgi:hypothetical protein